jgi:hypothetical protein
VRTEPHIWFVTGLIDRTVSSFPFDIINIRFVSVLAEEMSRLLRTISGEARAYRFDVRTPAPRTYESYVRYFTKYNPVEIRTTKTNTLLFSDRLRADQRQINR